MIIRGIMLASLDHAHVGRLGQVLPPSTGSLRGMPSWTRYVQGEALARRSIPTSGTNWCCWCRTTCRTTSALNPASFGCKIRHRLLNTLPIHAENSMFSRVIKLQEAYFVDASLVLGHTAHLTPDSTVVELPVCHLRNIFIVLQIQVSTDSRYLTYFSISITTVTSTDWEENENTIN